MYRISRFLPVYIAGLFMIATPVWSQTHLWSHRYGDVGIDESIATVDGAGNVLVTGRFQGTVDFGGGPLVAGGLGDVFVAKYDPTGAHLWSQSFGDTLAAIGRRIAADGTGNVFVTGLFEGTIDFGGGPLVSAGMPDIFVVKFNAAGAHIWSKRFGYTQFDTGWGIGVDAAGNVFVSGAFRERVDFGGGLLSSAGSGDIFVAKYTPAGAHIWSQRFGDTGSDASFGLGVDGAGNVIVTGSYAGTIDFGGGPLVSAGSQDMFLATYDPTGTHVWSQRFGGGGYDEGWKVAVDWTNRLVVTGFFEGSVDFGGGALVSAGGTDILVAKYNASGTHVWSRSYGDTGNDEGISVAVDGAGSAFVTGGFRGTVDFGGGPLTSAGLLDIFLVKYDALGAHLWSRHFGDTEGDEGFGVAVDGGGAVVMTGFFRRTVDFGGGPLTSPGNNEAFIAKYGPSSPTAVRGPSAALVLDQNYPNPFNPRTRIAFSLDRETHVSLAVYDATGKHVTTLVDRRVGAGTRLVEWDGRDTNGSAVASGIYFYRLIAGSRTLIRKAVLVK